MTLEEIRDLIKLATETGVAELEVQRGEHRVRIRRGVEVNSHDILIPRATDALTPHISASAADPAFTASNGEMEAEPGMDPSLLVVKAPIVGTFYEAPSSGAAPFVQPGETVHPGQVLCIIESMKLMNEIEAEFAGVVVSKLVTNAQPVEYGEALFAIRPL
jgi:acetyl-CoA carboxylase biotin carboxyl carrier protein